MAPRISLTTQTLPLAGLAATHAGPPTVDGDVVDVARNFLSVINGGTGPTVVTIVTPGVVDGDLAIADRTVTVPVGTTPTLIPLTSPNYRQSTVSALLPADVGRAYVNYSVLTSVTRAVVAL